MINTIFIYIIIDDICKGAICDTLSLANRKDQFKDVLDLKGIIMMGAMPYIYDENGLMDFTWGQNQRIFLIESQYDGVFPITQAARQWDLVRQIDTKFFGSLIHLGTHK